jgi:hypothetical protein
VCLDIQDSKGFCGWHQYSGPKTQRHTCYKYGIAAPCGLRIVRPFYRVFNRGSWTCGGRYYGPWWVRCPRHYRSKIHINDKPTIERDFTAHHIVLLYWQNWKERKVDPYLIPTPSFLQSPEQTREVAKLLILVALNAKSEADTFKAFRSKCENGSPEKRLTNDQLRLMDTMRERHRDIADAFASDAGIRLQYVDSLIATYIIEKLTAKGIPVLSLHDSFIVAEVLCPQVDQAIHP